MMKLMCQTVIPFLSQCRHYMTDAVATYEEKPRDQWLFDFPAQVSLCGTQIWWTSEVILASYNQGLLKF